MKTKAEIAPQAVLVMRELGDLALRTTATAMAAQERSRAASRPAADPALSEILADTLATLERVDPRVKAITRAIRELAGHDAAGA